MNQVETLLATLARRERLLRDARTTARHANTLTTAMDVIYGCEDLERGMADVLQLCREATGADLWILLRRAEGRLAVLAAAEPGIKALSWQDPEDFLARERRVTDLRDLPWFDALPAGLQEFRSFLSVPVEVPSEPPMAIGLVSRHRAAFSRFEQGLMRRVGQMLRQAIDNRRLAHRNAVLARVVDSAPGELPRTEGILDASFEALSRAYARISEWQSAIVDITNELLSAPTAQSQEAIRRTLARTGELARSDRTYVFRLRGPDRLDNTHEWVAPGIAPMIDQLQDMPASLMDDWRPDFAAERAVHIADVAALPEGSAVRDVLQMQEIRSLLAVPMLRDDRITGFVGYDAVRTHRRFLPVEIQLLQSVANAINVVMERAAAETAAGAARAGLEAERNRLHATLAAIPELVLELDRDGRFTSHVAGTGLQAAFPNEEFIGRLPEEVFPAELAALAREVMAIVDRDKHTEGHEYRLVIDGRTRWFLLSAAVRLEQGASAGYVFAIRDITTRIDERRQLQRLGKIAELTSNLVVVTDAAQRIEWVNPAFEQRTGWTLEEVRGKRPDAILATERTDRAELARIGAALRAGQPVRAELLNRSRTGEDYWISKDIQPLFGDGGQIQGFVAVQTDITDLKLSHQRALRDRAMALDASNDGIAITDAEGRYVYMNAAHRRMFGIGEDEDLSTLTWQDLLPPEAVARFMAEDWSRFETERSWRGELEGRHRDGSSVPQEVTLTLRDQGILCITRDISERLRLQADRTRLREELQIAQRRETIAHLASGVAHDLNNLVAVVAGSASLLSDFCADNEEARAGVERILRATETAKDLVSGLGHLGRQQKIRTSLDLREVILESVELLGTQRIRNHDISVSLPESPCHVWANVTELLQVIVNLALNACEAGSDGPNRVSLAILENRSLPDRAPDAGARRGTCGHVGFTISDTGTGIDKETRARLFERYFSTKGSSGTGLGLPIVNGILRDNDAALWIDSAPGRGTTVTVAWPTQPRETARTRTMVAAMSGPVDLKGQNILVVDDLADVADVLSEMLETAGAIAVAASDPEEARALLQDNPGLWSALVTDLDMPRMRGTELARHAAECTPPVPAVLVTALPEPMGEDARLFHAVLSKPIEAARLIAAVQGAIAAKAQTPA